LHSSAGDLVLDTVEREFLSKKLKKSRCDGGRDIRLIVHEVQIQLIVHDLPLLGRSEPQLLRE
jgi:hypothetical protein